MASFKLESTGGLEVVEWQDPASGENVSRLGSVPVAPHRRLRKIPSSGVVFFSAFLNGENFSRSDVDLDSELFKFWWAEAPDGGPAIYQPAWFSAEARCLPRAVGHYVLCARRRRSGGVLIHFDVDP